MWDSSYPSCYSSQLSSSLRLVSSRRSLEAWYQGIWRLHVQYTNDKKMWRNAGPVSNLPHATISQQLTNDDHNYIQTTSYNCSILKSFPGLARVLLSFQLNFGFVHVYFSIVKQWSFYISVSLCTKYDVQCAIAQTSYNHYTRTILHYITVLLRNKIPVVHSFEVLFTRLINNFSEPIRSSEESYQLAIVTVNE